MSSKKRQFRALLIASCCLVAIIDFRHEGQWQSPSAVSGIIAGKLLHQQSSGLQVNDAPHSSHILMVALFVSITANLAKIAERKKL